MNEGERGYAERQYLVEKKVLSGQGRGEGINQQDEFIRSGKERAIIETGVDSIQFSGKYGGEVPCKDRNESQWKAQVRQKGRDEFLVG